MSPDISSDWRYGQWYIQEDDEMAASHLCVIPPGISMTEMESRLSARRGVPMRLVEITSEGPCLQLE